MITLVYGDPGKGKTAYLTAMVFEYLNGSRKMWELYYKCCDEVQGLIDEGYRFTMPYKAPVYSNYDIRVFVGYDYDDNGNLIEVYTTPYLIDPHCIGFENDNYDVERLYPYSVVAIQEAQGPLDARMFASFPATTSRYYEKHRHFFIDFYLDAQRLDLIDKNVRAIAGRVIKMMGVDVKYDKRGKAKTVFQYYEFKSAAEADRFDASGVGNYELQTYAFNGNIFDYYSSYSCHDAFVPKSGDFSHREHPDPNSDTYLDEYETAYPQEAPEGFYTSKRRC